MNHEAETNSDEHMLSTRSMEVIVAGLLMLVGLIVMWDSWNVGASWAEFGPQSGYFPFRIGAILFFASGVVVVVNLATKAPNLRSFVDRSQLKAVLQVLVPTAVFVLSIGYLGIYLAGALYIAFFMWWLGRYPLYKIVPVMILIPLALFVLFEIWFLVPMPKGPIETALGF